MIEIPLVGKRAQGRTVMIDDADYECVAPHRWHVYERNLPNGRIAGPYAQMTVRREGGATKLLMHKLLTGFDRTDHINHNGLDNQRHNLRQATAAQNNFNSRSRIATSSQYKGVTWHRRIRKWQVTIKTNGKCRYLGCYASEDEAARIYNAAASEAFGEYACLNEVAA